MNMSVTAGWAVLVLLLSVLFALPSPAAAQNLLANPHFDTDLSGWPINNGGVFDGTRDANGSASSGSVGETITLGVLTGTFEVRQCVAPVTEGTSYDFGGKVLLTQAPTEGQGTVTLLWWSSNDCSTGILRIDSTSHVSTVGIWTPVSSTVVAPANAHSVAVSTELGTLSTGGTLQVNFDDMFFQVAGPPPPPARVPTLPAMGLLILSGLLATIAAWRLTRRRMRSA